MPTYNPRPGNVSTAGQVITPSSPVPQRGKPPTQIYMPDSSPESMAARGVRVGNLTLQPSAGPFGRFAVVVLLDGKELRGDGALWALLEELLIIEDAEGEAQCRSRSAENVTVASPRSA
jgi:hypothetical protein